MEGQAHFDDGAGQLETWIGNKRRPGIAYQHQGLAGLQLGQDAGPQFRRIVIMIGDEPGANPVTLEQFAGDPRILAEYLVGCGERINRP